jgi:YfiR/HmsC-like
MAMRVIAGARSFACKFRRHVAHSLSGLVTRVAAVGIACALLASITDGQQAKPSEYQVKATYLYNFGRFVKWPAGLPAGNDDSFAVCVIGQDPFGPILDSTLAGESLNGKPVALQRISKAQDAGNCRILFISATEEKHLNEILTALSQSEVLTVSDMPGFTRRGGMIQFVLEGDRVRFEINLSRAESARLVLSSELLKVATNVRRTGRSGD